MFIVLCDGTYVRRRKRDVDDLTDDVDDEEESPFDYGEDFVPGSVFDWPSDSKCSRINFALEKYNIILAL